jgi:4a-hydroxytetrahydrobiopterin dehydratase
MGDGDNLGAEPEREQHLGRGGDEAYDAHLEENDMTQLLTDDEIAERLASSDWEREGDEIVREWKFDDFVAGMVFVNRVAEVAEDANHHPDILLHGWNKVRLSLTNHSAGGLTEKDFVIAGRFDALA